MINFACFSFAFEAGCPIYRDPSIDNSKLLPMQIEALQRSPVVATATSPAYAAYFRPFAANSSILSIPVWKTTFCADEFQRRFPFFAIDVVSNSSRLLVHFIGNLAPLGTRCTDLA
jgi:hypothetical protein